MNREETPVVSLETMTAFLVEFGAADVPHTEKTYLGHALAVYRDMRSWQADDALCHAAMFHSIYGTEGFQTLTLPLDRRDELRQLIGDRAERLVYANCAMKRISFYAQVHQVRGSYEVDDRLTNHRIELSSRQFDDLMQLHLCDFLEQVERTEQWDYERKTFERMSERLGGEARKAYTATFARRPAGPPPA